MERRGALEETVEKEGVEKCELDVFRFRLGRQVPFAFLSPSPPQQGNDLNIERSLTRYHRPLSGTMKSLCRWRTREDPKQVVDRQTRAETRPSFPEPPVGSRREQACLKSTLPSVQGYPAITKATQRSRFFSGKASARSSSSRGSLFTRSPTDRAQLDVPNSSLTT